MHRRSFLGALLVAPVAIPAIVKAAEVAPDPLVVKAARFEVLGYEAARWDVRLDDNGYVVGFTKDGPMPVFEVATVDGQPKIAIRAEYLDALNGMAAHQNAALI